MNKKTFQLSPSRMLLVLAALILVLPVFTMNFTVSAQEGEETLLYSQNFEEQSASEWTLEPAWEIVPVESGYALSGAQHAWANLDAGYWDDFRLKFRIKPSPGSTVHINLRLAHPSRYFIGMGMEPMYLARQDISGDFQESLASGPALPSGWSEVEISLYGPDLTVSVNGSAAMTYSDPEPLDTGRVAFESISDAATLFDDIEVWGEAPENVEELDSGLTWVRTGGPLGGLGYDVRMHPDNPDILYVTDGWAGVFMSTDGGETWFPSNEGITTRKGESQDSIPIFCLTIDPHNHDIIWAGTEHAARIYKSTNGGAGWSDVTNNIRDSFFDGLTFRGFTVHPENSDIVYTAAELHSWANGREPRQGREFEMVEGIVFRTEDGGGTWMEVWRGQSLARYIWINPQNPDVLYISTGIFDREAANSDPEAGLPGGEGVLKSTDGGETWQHANNGLGNLYVGSLYMHPEDPDILLAGTGNNQYFQQSGVYLTEDGAENWVRTMDGDFAEVIESVEFVESDPQIAYAGSANAVYRSNDGGHSWDKVSGMDWGPDGVRVGFPIDFQVDPRDPDRLFANAYGGGNFLSEDGGATWQASSKGYTGAQVRDIAVHPQQPGVVYAAARSGLFISTNGGEDWTGISYPPAKVMEWNAVALNPAHPSHLAAGNNWNSDLLISFDAGASWEISQNSIIQGPNGISTIAFSPSNPDILYAATAGFQSAGSFDPFLEATGIHVSRDRGETWQPANSDLTRSAGVADLAVHPMDPDSVYAASTTHGLLHTTDGGASWQRLPGLPEQGCSAVALHQAAPDFLLAGFERGGIYSSPDGGEAWQRSGSGMPPEATIKSIVFHPQDPDVVFAADIQSGVYRSSDRGETWSMVNDGLRTRAVNALAISSDGMHLYAATEGEGVFRLDLNGEAPEEGEPFVPQSDGASREQEPASPEEKPEEEKEADGAEQETEPIPADTPSGNSGLCGSVIMIPLALGTVAFVWKKDRHLIR